VEGSLVEHNALKLGLEPLDGIVLGKTVGLANLALQTSQKLTIRRERK